jgi:hypothetical protein
VPAGPGGAGLGDGSGIQSGNDAIKALIQPVYFLFGLPFGCEFANQTFENHHDE